MPQLEWNRLPLDDSVETWRADSAHTSPDGTRLFYGVCRAHGTHFKAYGMLLTISKRFERERHESLEAAKAACQANEDALDKLHPCNGAELLAACEAVQIGLHELLQYENALGFGVHSKSLKKLIATLEPAITNAKER